jgi:hypothetical protein
MSANTHLKMSITAMVWAILVAGMRLFFGRIIVAVPIENTDGTAAPTLEYEDRQGQFA